MPTIPAQETIVQYVANSLQTQYTFAFYAPLNTDIDVYYQASNATPIPASDILTLNVDYTVTFNADPITGGYITLLFTPTTGYYLTINRDVAATLDVNFANAQNFSGSNLDAALNRLLLLIQQNQNYALQRNLSYIINTYLPDAAPFTQLPPLADGQIWYGSTSGVIAATLEQNPDVSTLRSELADEQPVTNGASLVGYYDTVNSAPTTVKAFLDNIVPFMQTQLNLQLIQPGTMFDYAGTSVPTGYLLCDGSAISRTTYSDLFTAIGTTWGIGDGSSTFNLPDFSRRVAVGSGGSGTGTLGNSTGDTGGEETHLMTQAELVAHTHTYQEQTTNVGTAASGGSFGIFTATSQPTGSTGSSTPFNVMQPSAIVTKIIKY